MGKERIDIIRKVIDQLSFVHLVGEIQQGAGGALSGEIDVDTAEGLEPLRWAVEIYPLYPMMAQGCESIRFVNKGLMIYPHIMEEGNLSVSLLAEKCGVSRQAVMKWQKGSIPKSRDLFIRIALAAGYSLDRTNDFLMKYGRCPALYAKSLEDAVYIFILFRKDRSHISVLSEDHG